MSKLAPGVSVQQMWSFIGTVEKCSTVHSFCQQSKSIVNTAHKRHWNHEPSTTEYKAHHRRPESI